VQAIARIKQGVSFPVIDTLPENRVESLVKWYSSTLNQYASAMGMNRNAEDAFAQKRALKELEVEAPTRWELTFDLTHTPAWREIVAQLKQWAHFHSRERTLLFTPAGEVALPSGLPVDWSARDIRSQKHVLIACKWPKPGQAVKVKARRLFAQQSCGKIGKPFWD
jgi:hypothetical protein